MAISSIVISQDNIILGSNLVPIHSPVVFLIDVTHSGLVPNTISVDLIFNAVVQKTYSCIPYKDLSTTIRQFAFIANDAIKSLMDDFDDFAQLTDVLVNVENITKLITLKFFDPDLITTFDEVELNFIHAANQFNENANLLEVYDNDPDTYYTNENGYVYIYFYNNDPAATLSIGVDTGGPPPSVTASNPIAWPYFIGYSLPKSRATIDLLRTDADPLRTSISPVTYTFHMPSGDTIVNKNAFLNIGDPVSTIDSGFIDTEALTVGTYPVDFDGDFPQQTANIEALNDFVVYEVDALTVPKTFQLNLGSTSLLSLIHI